MKLVKGQVTKGNWRETRFSGTSEIRSGHRCAQQLLSGNSGGR